MTSLPICKTAFTPGPWTVDDGGIRCGHEHNYGVVAQARDGHVYSEYTSDSPTLEFYNQADADLIAAAPALYEALEVIASCGAVDASNTAIVVGHDANIVLQQAQAALILARGEDQ